MVQLVSQAVLMEPALMENPVLLVIQIANPAHPLRINVQNAALVTI